MIFGMLNPQEIWRQ